MIRNVKVEDHSAERDHLRRTERENQTCKEKVNKEAETSETAAGYQTAILH